MDLIGRKAEDKVTGFKGVIESVSFDLYGCIQGLLRPQASKTGELKDGFWLDVSRLKVSKTKPVMKQPNWSYGDAAEGGNGPAKKPTPR